MALSGSYESSSRSYGGVNANLKISWSATQSISGNYSKVTAKLYLVITQGGIAANGDGKLTIGGNGNSFSHGSTYKGTGTHLLKTATETINHSSDGSKSFSLKGSYSNDWWGSISIGSKTFTLDTIPRNSKVSSPSSFNLGSAFTITTNRKSSSFTHTLILSSGGFTRTYTGVGASKSITTSGDFENELAVRYPNAKTATVSITCRCYSGSTLIGTSTTSIKANFVESRMRPTVTVPTFTETNASVLALGLPANNFIQNVSKVSVDVGPMVTQFNATPNKYELAWGSYVGTLTGASGTINNATPSDTTKPTLKGIDSRGFTSTAVTASNVNVVPYVQPSFEEVSLKRVNGVEPIVRLSLTANLALVKVNNIVKNNVQSLRWRYALKGSASWSSWSNLDGYSFNTSTGQLTLSERQIHNNLDADNSYDVQIEINDLFNTVIYQKSISKATPTLSIKNNSVAVNEQAIDGYGGLTVNGHFNLKPKLLTGDGSDVSFWRDLKPGLYWNNQTITNLPFIKASNYGFIEVKKYGPDEYLITYTQASSTAALKGSVLVTHINAATTSMVWKRLNECVITIYDNSAGRGEGQTITLPSGYVMSDFEEFRVTTAGGMVMENRNGPSIYITYLDLLRYNGVFSYYIELWLTKTSSTVLTVERVRYINHRHATTSDYHNEYDSDTRRVVKIEGILKSLYA